MSRLARRMLLVAAVVVLAPVVALAAFVGWGYARADLDTLGQADHRHPLPVPSLAPSRVIDGVRTFDLTLREGRHDFGTGLAVPTAGISQDYLGPTLRARRGERVRVDVTNRLGEPSTLHWHGMHLPPRADGSPHQPIAPGSTWSPSWTVDQPAASLWYHPHLHGTTADHVYRGLAGMFLLDDDTSAAADLPHAYGVDDIPVIVQDKAFRDNGHLDDGTRTFSSVGVLGDTVVVNGVVTPHLDVVSERVRLRLVNASNARIYDFAFTDGREFAQVATDGGLLPTPHLTERVGLSPGERAEIVVTLAPGEQVGLVSLPTRIAGDLLQQRWNGGDDRLAVMQLRAAEVLRPSPDLPARLAADTDDLSDDEVAQQRSFRLSTPRINGQEMDSGRIDLAAVVDTTERWTVRNEDGAPHNFHVHDVQFQVVTVDGAPPPPALRGRKDTVFLPGNTEMVLALRFTDHTDPDVPYMFHCHVLRHEDDGMMGQFVVVRPGQPAGRPPYANHGAPGAAAVATHH